MRDCKFSMLNVLVHTSLLFFTKSKKRKKVLFHGDFKVAVDCYMHNWAHSVAAVLG